MFTRRLFNIFVAVALLVVIGLTVREVAATTVLISTAGSTKMACGDLSSMYSIRTEYVEERKAWVSYTEDGPTGVDGGLIYLTSVARSCTR